jgi:hypothetical protein
MGSDEVLNLLVRNRIKQLVPGPDGPEVVDLGQGHQFINLVP